MARTAQAWLTYAECAAHSGCSEKTIARLVQDGRLAARRVLGRVRIRRSDLLKLLEGEPVSPKAGG